MDPQTAGQLHSRRPYAWSDEQMKRQEMDGWTDETAVNRTDKQTNEGKDEQVDLR